MLERVRRFCNTTNLESGADRLREPSDFARWLTEQGHEPFLPSSSQRRLCVDLREALRSAAVSHRRSAPDHDALAEIVRLVSGVRFVVGIDADRLSTLVDPAQGACERFVGSMALAVTATIADGTWERLTACRNCRWVVFDASKNRSTQWCSMSACGGRAKVRRHRSRR